MNLYNGTLRPGVVLEVNDDGTIKASAPGLFSAEDSLELLPPIYPFPIGNSNTFSKPEVGDEVWVLHFSDNAQQLHWFRKDESVDANAELGVNGEADVEVVCNREVGMGNAAIYFSNGTGWIIQNCDSKIQLKPDGSIVIGTGLPKQTISISGRGISLGTEGQSKYSAVLGEELVNLFNELLSILGKVGTAAMASPYTASIGAILKPLPTKMAQSVSGILSSNVTLE